VERSAALELHHHVNSAVGAEEVEHAHHIGCTSLASARPSRRSTSCRSGRRPDGLR
jgi:hypothetical protein